MNGEPTIRLAAEHDVPAMFRVRTAVRENHLSMADMDMPAKITFARLMRAIRLQNLAITARNPGRMR